MIQSGRLVLWAELDELMAAGFTGKVVLHANQGDVVKYEVHETKRPRGDDGVTLRKAS